MRPSGQKRENFINRPVKTCKASLPSEREADKHTHNGLSLPSLHGDYERLKNAQDVHQRIAFYAFLPQWTESNHLK